ncbi:MAG TPA: hypothetical protein VK841_20430 [Polyangiaceae bacterium]|jgi:hypothetical protein|nr:hypothetical protein [Polyangiaceae bacterium]
MTRPGRHALECGDLTLEVDPAAGGRVTSFRCGDLEALSGPDVDANNYGSTLWTSPQSDWGWPPPIEFDGRPYAIERSDDAIALAGPVIGSLGVAFEKRFAVDRARGAFAITYAIRNATAVARRVAPWEVSRVPARGLTFFPTGAAHVGPLPVAQHGGMTWYAHAPETLDDTGQKHSADGRDGYLAHAGNGLLLVKTFADLPPEMQAPGEGEVEVYGNNRYVEVEAQGPYASIEPGAVLEWTLRWYLVPLAASEARIGNPRLLESVHSILEREVGEGSPRRKDAKT